MESASATKRAVIRLRSVTELTGLQKSTIYRMEKEGRCPRRIRLGTRASGWILSEWEAWIAARMQARGELS